MTLKKASIEFVNHESLKINGIEIMPDAKQLLHYYHKQQYELFGELIGAIAAKIEHEIIDDGESMLGGDEDLF